MKLTGASTTFSILLASTASAQTYSTCNPTQQSCPPDPALGTSSNVQLTSESSDYDGTGNGISYGSSGAQLSVSQSGDNPTLTSNWYIMFGRVDWSLKSAPGTGMVSSAILISDDLDEIDWELLGADSSQAQSNYFSKGTTGAYDRGGFSSVPTSQSDFNTYSVDWNADRIIWEINGSPVRTLTYAQSGGQYPQSPMQVKVGAWAGGDSSNAEGTIEWAGGPIDYSSGPYSMYVQSINVQDYSTGSQYSYTGTSGSWHDITAVDGSINSSGSSSGATPSDGGSTDPSTTWTGTHETTSAFSTPSVYPWVPASNAQPSSDSATAGPPASSYLASLGYDTSSAPATSLADPSSTPSPSPSSPADPSACETITTYNQQGFPTEIAVPLGYGSSPKQFDDQGFEITPTCNGQGNAARTPARNNRAASPTTLALVTSAPAAAANEGAQANAAEARPHSSQARDDRTFYQSTDTGGPSPFDSGAGRTVGGAVAVVGLLTAALAVAL